MYDSNSRRDARLMEAVAGMGSRSVLSSEVDLRLGLSICHPGVPGRIGAVAALLRFLKPARPASPAPHPPKPSETSKPPPEWQHPRCSVG